MTNHTATATTTPATVLDAAGSPCCHTAGQTVKSERSARKSAIRQTAIDAWTLMGWTRYTASGVLEAQCQTTGEWHPVDHADNAPRPVNRARVIEASHVVPTANGGVWCGCVLLPERGDLNASRGGATWTPDVDMAAYGAAFRAAWIGAAGRHGSQPLRIRKAI